MSAFPFQKTLLGRRRRRRERETRCESLPLLFPTGFPCPLSVCDREGIGDFLWGLFLSGLLNNWWTKVSCAVEFSWLKKVDCTGYQTRRSKKTRDHISCPVFFGRTCGAPVGARTTVRTDLIGPSRHGPDDIGWNTCFFEAILFQSKTFKSLLLSK